MAYDAWARSFGEVIRHPSWSPEELASMFGLDGHVAKALAYHGGARVVVDGAVVIDVPRHIIESAGYSHDVAEPLRRFVRNDYELKTLASRYDARPRPRLSAGTHAYRGRR